MTATVPERLREVLEYVDQLVRAGQTAEVQVDHNHGMDAPRIDRGAQTITLNRHDFHAVKSELAQVARYWP